MAKTKQTALVEGQEDFSQGISSLAEILEMDFTQLTGENFRRYAAVVGDSNTVSFDRETGEETTYPGQLKENDMYFFELFKVEPQFRDRFPGMPGSPRDFVGVKLKKDQPEMRTLTSVKNARLYNAQIVNDNGLRNGKYYLLSKTQRP